MASARSLVASVVALGAILAAALCAGSSTTPAVWAQDWPSVELVPLPATFSDITEIVNAGDGSGRLYVVERQGTIRVVEPGSTAAPAPFLDIVERVGSVGTEQGLLGLAFSPSFETDRHFYVNYTDLNGDTVVSRFTALSGTDADEGTETVVLQVDQPYGNHNGGRLAFGPDGLLYIGMGDGGSAGDPGDRAQDDASMLGKILRYHPHTGDVDMVAKGLRNPWKFSFDRETGDVYIADVGQQRWEEVNFVPGGTLEGRNFGWRRMEGNHCFFPPNCSPQGFDVPVHEYSHEEGCSVTGGYVARQEGSALEGVYVFSDYCTGAVWGLRRDAEGRWARGTLGQAGGLVTTFGEGEDGALYVAVNDGEWRVYRIDAGRELPELPFSVVFPGLAADS